MNARTCAAVLLALGLASRASGQCYLTQIERIKPSPTAPGDFFGYCKLYDDVAIFTNLEGISINRNAYVMHHDGTQWVQDQILTAWGNWQGGFGYSAAMDGNFVAVGAPYDSSVISNNGAVYMFEYDGTQWVQDVKLVASNASFLDQFGNEMDIEGNLMAVTAWEVSPTVFRHDGTTWVEEQALVPSDVDADDGADMICIEGNRIVFSHRRKLYPDGKGVAYVFEFDGTSWVEQQLLRPWDLPLGSEFGSSIALDGDRLAVGATLDQPDFPNGQKGAVYVFRYDGTAWQPEQKLLHSDRKPLDNLGISVALDGDLLVTGSQRQSGNEPASGAAYVFQYDGTSWIEQRKLVVANGKHNDLLGWPVALRGTRALIGAIAADSPGVDAGAAYEFDLSGVGPTAFSVYPDTAALNDTVVISSCGGVPSHLLLLFLMSVDGVPFPLRLLQGSYGPFGTWSLNLTVPPDGALVGLDLGFQVFHLNAQNTIGATNPDNLLIQ